MRRLTKEEIAEGLGDLPGWTGNEARLEAWFVWPTFAAGLQFVNEVGALAEAASHHPDLDIRYNRVRVGLSTHDAGGVTDRDLALARAIGHAARGLRADAADEEAPPRRPG